MGVHFLKNINKFRKTRQTKILKDCEKDIFYFKDYGQGSMGVRWGFDGFDGGSMGVRWGFDGGSMGVQDLFKINKFC